jgi:hypothetical protein
VPTIGFAFDRRQLGKGRGSDGYQKKWGERFEPSLRTVCERINHGGKVGAASAVDPAAKQEQPPHGFLLTLLQNKSVGCDGVLIARGNDLEWRRGRRHPGLGGRYF